MSWFSALVLGAPKSASAIGPMVIDPKRRTLCDFDGTTSRDAVEERLGPPTQYWARRRGVLNYEHLGLIVNLDASHVLVGYFILYDDFAELYRWVPHGGAPTEDELVKLLGPPTKRESDEEIMLLWERGVLVLGVDYSLAGKCIDIHVDFR